MKYDRCYESVQTCKPEVHTVTTTFWKLFIYKAQKGQRTLRMDGLEGSEVIMSFVSILPTNENCRDKVLPVM